MFPLLFKINHIMSDTQKNTEGEKDADPKEPTFAERFKIEPIRRQCVCGRSKKYPLCDGSHSRE
jgi:CDGSH-type Zn-finger protein